MNTNKRKHDHAHRLSSSFQHLRCICVSNLQHCTGRGTDSESTCPAAFSHPGSPSSKQSHGSNRPTQHNFYLLYINLTNVNQTKLSTSIKHTQCKLLTYHGSPQKCPSSPSSKTLFPHNIPVHSLVMPSSGLLPESA